MAEFRQDPLTGRWTLISPERLRYMFRRQKKVRAKVKPFVPLLQRTYPVPRSRAALEIHGNAFPAIGPWPNRLPLQTTTNAHVSKRGVGEQYLVRFSHGRDITAASAQERQAFAKAVAVEFARLNTNRRVKMVTLFRNNGEAAGASLVPPHYQLWGVPIPSNAHEQELLWLRRLKTCPTCKLVRQIRPWLVASNSAGKLYCPPASQFAGAVTLVPTRHVRSFVLLEKSQQTALVELLALALKKLRAQFGDLAFNEIWHEYLGSDPRTHFRIEILPRLLRPASLEHGHNFFINPLIPEKIARLLRLKKVRLTQ